MCELVFALRAGGWLEQYGLICDHLSVPMIVLI